MWADGSSASCRSTAASPVSANTWARAAPTRSRISAAAAFVNVTTSSSVMSTGLSLSRRRRIMRSTRTAVLPDPAAADSSSVCPRLSMAACCSGVHAMFAPSFVQFFQQILFPYRHDVIAVVGQLRVKPADGVIGAIAARAGLPQ